MWYRVLIGALVMVISLLLIICSEIAKEVVSACIPGDGVECTTVLYHLSFYVQYIWNMFVSTISLVILVIGFCLRYVFDKFGARLFDIVVNAYNKLFRKKDKDKE